MENVTVTNIINSTTEATSSTLKVTFDVILTTVMVMIMLGMGCTIEINKLLGHLRRPIGAGIGMVAQFIVLPLITFGLARALQLDSLAAIGMLVMGCCPGGSTSNMFSYWADGDVPLSLTMTSIGTLFAMGMMPLNLWLYSSCWTDENLVIPYINIIIALSIIVVPAGVGIFIRWKFEKAAAYIAKVCSGIGVLTVVLTITIMSMLYPFMYSASFKIYAAAFVFPFIGFLFGYVIVILCRMDHTQSRTVALETGIQNFPLCMTIISLSFDSDVIPKLALFPLLYGILCLTNSCIFVCGYLLLKRCLERRSKRDNLTRTEFTRVSNEVKN